MIDHPYRNAAPARLWRQAMAAVPPDKVDPVSGFPFRIGAADQVVTAGSCFAQHIARALRQAGFSPLVTETAHPVLSAGVAETYGYGVYSARYGNIYTARQLRQLIQRAYGRFTPAEDVWVQDGRWFDPFRPAIQPGGFATEAEYRASRAAHFAAVREALARLDVLVFTLGLTEAWESRLDGAVFPLCPGTVAGAFDPARHALRDFSVDEVVADLTAAITDLRAINPGARVILTVSPVPLAATAHDMHVLTATTHAKAVLRVAAGIVSRMDRVAYFPSYEIVTGPHARGYVEPDLRSVSAAGVDHVMRVFFRHCVEAGVAPLAARTEAAGVSVMQVICEEESLAAG